MFNHDHHKTILAILQTLNRPLFEENTAYFGGGTLLALKFGEYRWSQDIDFICPVQNKGYRGMRTAVHEQGYRALFPEDVPFELPRDIRFDQYGIRFPIRANGHTIKFEIISENRIDLDPPDYPDWSPMPCLSHVDCFAEKLLANADRYIDHAIRARDLIDLAVLRTQSPIPPKAIQKAEDAYPVIDSLIKAIQEFQNHPDYRRQCFTELQIEDPVTIIDGLDLLASDHSLAPTERDLAEEKEDFYPRA